MMFVVGANGAKWGPWSTDCGQAIRTRTRECLVVGHCAGSSIDTEIGGQEVMSVVVPMRMQQTMTLQQRLKMGLVCTAKTRLMLDTSWCSIRRVPPLCEFNCPGTSLLMGTSG